MLRTPPDELRNDGLSIGSCRPKDATMDRFSLSRESFDELSEASDDDEDYLGDDTATLTMHSAHASMDKDAPHAAVLMEHALHSLRQKRNKRERIRWRKIRDAFDALRDKVPRGQYEELSQLQTLRRAVLHIRYLHSLLRPDHGENDVHDRSPLLGRCGEFVSPTGETDVRTHKHRTRCSTSEDADGRKGADLLRKLKLKCKLVLYELFHFSFQSILCSDTLRLLR